MLGKSLAIIVASPREKSGTTLLSRLFADFFMLAGDAPILFDTDIKKPKFSKYYPGRAELIDLENTKGQMSLFDRLPLRSHVPKIVDVSSRSFSTVFSLLRDIEFIREARENAVEPVIVYLPQFEADDYERGFRMREHFDCQFVLAENAFLGNAPQSLHQLTAYWALKAHPVHLMMPRMDPMNMSLLEDERISFGEFLRQTAPKNPMPTPGQAAHMPLAYLSFDARSKIRGWLKPALHEIQRTVNLVQQRIETPPSEVEPF